LASFLFVAVGVRWNCWHFAIEATSVGVYIRLGLSEVCSTLQ